MRWRSAASRDWATPAAVKTRALRATAASVCMKTSVPCKRTGAVMRYADGKWYRQVCGRIRARPNTGRPAPDGCATPKTLSNGYTQRKLATFVLKGDDGE